MTRHIFVLVSMLQGDWDSDTAAKQRAAIRAEVDILLNFGVREGVISPGTRLQSTAAFIASLSAVFMCINRPEDFAVGGDTLEPAYGILIKQLR